LESTLIYLMLISLFRKRCALVVLPTTQRFQSFGFLAMIVKLQKVQRRRFGEVDAICVPGGFGVRGIEGKLGALKFARENKIPTLGLCLGLQCMVIEAARNLAGIKDANSAEFSPESGTHVIATMDDQKEIVSGQADMGGTMRLGLYTATSKARFDRG
jgi:CTP synthase (UTP-ammonia lyase)